MFGKSQNQIPKKQNKIGVIMLAAFTFFVGLAIGGGLVIMFSKNNKNTIEKSRQQILDAAEKGREHLNEVLNKLS